jgi:glyoxylase-like metal-dependent hydrolase (beta-lactamase superfamily II)
MEITGTAQRAAWVAGEFPPVEQLRPDLWSIPVPLPDLPLRYVLVYALAGDDGWVIVDAGWDTEEAWRALVDGLATAGAAITDVRGVLVTHIHPDHYGLAGRVRQASGAWVALHPADAAALQGRYGDVDELLVQLDRQLVTHGVPESEATGLVSASLGLRGRVVLVAPDVLLEDGDTPPVPAGRLRAVWTPGHSPGHLCFYDEGRALLFSGDHILPRISPTIMLHPQQRPDPLGDFLEALERVGRLPATEVLPAHEYRFRGLADRVDQLIGHHRARLAELAGQLPDEPGPTAWEMAERVSWSRPWAEIPSYLRRVALGETLAHLTYLSNRGRARDDGGLPRRWAAGAARHT